MPYNAKAIYAAVVALLGTLSTALLPNGTEAANVISTSEWVAIALSAVLAYGGTYGIQNGTRGHRGP